MIMVLNKMKDSNYLFYSEPEYVKCKNDLIEILGSNIVEQYRSLF